MSAGTIRKDAEGNEWEETGEVRQARFGEHFWAYSLLNIGRVMRCNYSRSALAWPILRRKEKT